MPTVRHSISSFFGLVLRIVFWLFVGSLGVIILALTALQFPAAQRAIIQLAVSQIANKTHTRIEVGSVNIDFPTSVVLRDVFVGDVVGDTLVALRLLSVDVDLFRLWSNEVILNKVRIDSMTAYVTRSLPDSSLNFDFILKALASDTADGAGSDPTTEPVWKVQLGELELNACEVTYADDVSGISLRLDLGMLEAKIDTFDLPSHRIALDRFLLAKSNVVVARTDSRAPKPPPSEGSGAPWNVTLGQLTLEDDRVRYDLRNAEHRMGIDPDHLWLEGVNLRAENVQVSEQLNTAHVSSMSFRDRSGLQVRQISGGFAVDSVHARVADLVVETASSRIQQDLLLSYGSMSSLLRSPGEARVIVTSGDCRISVSDLLLIQPSLPLKDTPGTTVGFSAKLSGPIRDVRIESFRISTGDSTVVELAGEVRGLPDTKSAFYAVELSRLSFGRGDLLAILPDTLVPSNIALPAYAVLSGTFVGTEKQFSSSAVLVSDHGKIKAVAVMDSGRGGGSAMSHWKVDLAVQDLDLGSLLDDPEMFGPVSLTATADGTGMTAKDLQAHVDLKVSRAVVHGYPYQRLALRGTVWATGFDGKVEIRDSSLDATFTGIVNIAEKDPVVQCTLDVSGVDLRRLNITNDDIRLAGVITSDLAGKDVNELHGKISAYQIAIVKNDKRYSIDSVVVTSDSSEGRTLIRLESAILAGQLEGSIAPGLLPDVIREHVTRYVAVQDVQRTNARETQAFTFRVALLDPTILTEVFFPDLHRLDIGTLEGSFDGRLDRLQVTMDVPRFDYHDMRIDSLKLMVTSDPNLMQATVSVRSISDSTLLLSDLQIAALAGHDSVHVAMQSSREDGEMNVRIAGVFKIEPDGGYSWRFDKDGVVLQSLPWNVPNDNVMFLGSGGLRAHHVEFTGDGQSFSLESGDVNGSSSSLHLEFKNWNLSSFTSMFSRDTSLLGGTLDGHVILPDQGRSSFTSDLTIKDLKVRRTLVGNVVLHASHQTEHEFEIVMDISGSGNQIAVRGTYRDDLPGGLLDLTCDLTQVDLSSIEPWTFGNVRRISGTMNGALHMSGSMDRPTVTGVLKFTNAAFNPALLNSYLRLDHGQIEFDGAGVVFRSFDLVDTLGNKASISGRVLTEDFLNYRFDMRVHAERFLLMNKPASREGLYYGTVFLGCDLTVKGDRSRPVIDMRAVLEKGTHLTLILPESQLGVEERRGIVRFVDSKVPATTIMSRPGPGSSSDTTEFFSTAMELAAQVTVTRESRLRIVVDPVAGDSLVIQGDATLSLAVDAGGRLTLAGQYEIAQGTYVSSLGGLLTRAFDIERGSKLTWLGTPYKADVAITAVHSVKAAVLDLIEDQLTGVSDAERNKYKQEFPIQVRIIMSGKLLSPEIHFRLDLAPEKRGVLNGTVYAKLNELNNQESELNKQVFALLVLGRFLPERPLNVANGMGGVTGYARSSVSQMLSTQLNRLSERYISGADLDVGVESYEDYSSGTAEGRTQLQLALSKQLFDERVTVQVGGNVDVEGQRSQQKILNNFAGDVSVAYKLTEDGRWQLQVFRQNSYEGAIDGDVLKTGVGVMFTIEYDTLFGLSLKPAAVQKAR